MIIGIITNIGLLSLGALVFHFALINGELRELSRRHKVLIGFCFGALSLVVVNVPVQLPIGATFDTRAAPVVLSGFFAGPLGGLICAGIAGVARFHVGGPAVIGGTMSPFVYALVGIIAGHIYANVLRRRPMLLDFALLGIISTVAVVPCFFIGQGWDFGITVLEKAWHVLLIGNLAGILLLGMMSEQILKTITAHSETSRALVKLDLAYSSAKIAAWRYEFESDRLEWDTAMFDLYEVSPETFGGTFSDWARCVLEEDILHTNEAFQEAQKTGASFEYQFRIRRRDGTHKWLQAHGKFIPDPDGKFVEVFGVNWDITEEKKLERALKQSELEARERSEELEITFSSMKQGVSVFDETGKLIYANRRVPEILGLPEIEFCPGRPFSDLLERHRQAGNFFGDSERSAERVKKVIGAGRVIRTKAKLRDDRVVTYTLSPKPNGGWVETVEDITESAAAEARIMTAAETDALTSLGNRLAFNKALQRAVWSAPPGNPADALLLLDLNNFKNVNDTYGHQVGDKVLQKTAAILRRACRANDFAARLGGDEFALIIHTADAASVDSIAHRLAKQFAAPLQIDALNLQFSAAIGVAPITNGATTEEILVRADAAMYKAKSEKLNHFRIFDSEIATEMMGLRQLQSELVEVVGTGSLEVHYQPIMSLQSGRIEGAEALVRWRKMDGSFVSPATFIPLAEDAGLIGAIGKQVLHSAIASARRWPEHMRLSVNVSPKQLGAGEFLEDTLDVLRSLEFDADRLELEVTESILIDRGSAALDELLDLKGEGIRIALDDFGTGYSSLSYLHHFKFDKLKIDRAFVMPMEEDPTCAAIVYTILNLCQNLGLECTAEGVETEQQRRLLTVAGCQFGQGFHFSRPVSEPGMRRLAWQSEQAEGWPDLAAV